MQTDHFEWDDDKAAAAARKHGVDFWTAARVFDDPYRIESEDGTRHQHRSKSIGMAGRQLLAVIHADGIGGRIRIITAWPATKDEHDDYSRQWPQA